MCVCVCEEKTEKTEKTEKEKRSVRTIVALYNHQSIMNISVN